MTVLFVFSLCFIVQLRVFSFVLFRGKNKTKMNITHIKDNPKRASRTGALSAILLFLFVVFLLCFWLRPDFGSQMLEAEKGFGVMEKHCRRDAGLGLR